LPQTLGFLRPTKPKHHPAVICAFAIPDEPEPGILAAPRAVNAVHLILLRPDGSGKAGVEKPKISVGSPCGLPIVLAPGNDLLGLAICEGVEDALSASEAGLEAWAAGGSNFMPKLAASVPPYVECVTIFAHDDGGAQYALELGELLNNRGFEVRFDGI
jgi:putative DNA primase/helicase